MRQIQIFLPKDKLGDVLEFLQDTLELINVFSVKGDTNAMISLRVSEVQSTRVIDELKGIGIGVEYGLIDILPIVVTVPLIEEIEEPLESSLQAPFQRRVVTEELYRSVSADARVSIDYLWFVAISALVAGLGIIQNSGVAVVASMLLAPLMGPILGFSLSYVVKDRRLTRNSLIAEGTGLGLSFVCGLILGLLTSRPAILPDQMAARGNPGIIDVLIALLSGLAIAYALGRGITSSLVGVAIAASLMPPAVNVGIALMWREVEIAFGSLILLLANILIIDIVSIGMFAAMKIQPVGVLAPTWRGLTQEQVPRRFWSKLFGQKKKKKPVQPKEVEPPSAIETPLTEEISENA
ncbi:MAG: TIGR00341 family protein [Candidatus Heimdallarchaeota archaeon]